MNSLLKGQGKSNFFAKTIDFWKKVNIIIVVSTQSVRVLIENRRWGKRNSRPERKRCFQRS